MTRKVKVTFSLKQKLGYAKLMVEAASGVASIVGYHTDFSGEETMGIIGQLLYGDEINGN